MSEREVCLHQEKVYLQNLGYSNPHMRGDTPNSRLKFIYGIWYHQLGQSYIVCLRDLMKTIVCL